MKRKLLWLSVFVLELAYLVVSPTVSAGVRASHELEPFHGGLAGLPPQAQQSIVNQLAKLTASEGLPGGYFGFSAAISGNTVVIGAPYASVDGNSHQGAAYGFVKPASGWADMTETAKLTASDGAIGDWLGASVGVAGGPIIAGAPQFDVSKPGAAYVFGSK
jgi:hypothetical protein